MHFIFIVDMSHDTNGLWSIMKFTILVDNEILNAWGYFQSVSVYITEFPMTQRRLESISTQTQLITSYRTEYTHKKHVRYSLNTV